MGNGRLKVENSLTRALARVREEDLSSSIERAIDFLYRNQLPWGEFKILACWNRWLLAGYFDSSPFVTSFVLYSLKDLEHQKVKKMTEKALNFLLSEQEKGGIWRFWTKRNKKNLPPDLDDIANISFILKLNKVGFDDNLQLILNNRNQQGLFFTFIKTKEKPNLSDLTRLIINAPLTIKCLKDIDAVVNTNVLLYLGQSHPSVCSFLNYAIKYNRPRSIHYPGRLTLFYMISRAFRNNITVLEENREIIIKSTLSYQKKDGSFGSELKTALSLNTLFNFDYSGKEVESGINYLLTKQLANGCWKRAVFFVGPFPYRYYGSEELTTALAVEAMKNYLYGKNF